MSVSIEVELGRAQRDAVQSQQSLPVFMARMAPPCASAKRAPAGSPPQSFGTRRQYGHVSRYRLEGSRIMFSFLDADIRASFTEYRKDLEGTADLVDIQSLSRNEQLAYWINLHNVALIEKIASTAPAAPSRRRSRWR